MRAWLAAILVVVACGRAPEPAGAPPAADPGVRVRPVVDSHVHLQYWKVADELARTGVRFAVDLGAPIDTVGRGGGSLTVFSAGPMLTRPGGYPINAWDPGGYGVGCDEADCVEAAVAAVRARGGEVIKVVAGADGLAPPLIERAVAAARRREMKVVAHALRDADARIAGLAGCDALAHTPVEALTDETIAAWRGENRAVISTLTAFGGSPTTVDNLRRLRAAGLIVLYGTDLGNTRVAGIDPDELRLLGEAGLDPPAIVDALTRTPLAYWGFLLTEDDYLMLDGDPSTDPTAFLRPRFLEGRRL
jgi:hypothetical protein